MEGAASDPSAKAQPSESVNLSGPGSWRRARINVLMGRKIWVEEYHPIHAVIALQRWLTSHDSRITLRAMAKIRDFPQQNTGMTLFISKNLFISLKFKATSKNVIPAKAGIQKLLTSLDRRFCGNGKLIMVRGSLKLAGSIREGAYFKKEENVSILGKSRVRTL